MDVKYPDIEVELLGQDGNAFGILGKVQRALRENEVPKKEIAQYMEEATAGDYDHLLATTMKWVNVS